MVLSPRQRPTTRASVDYASCKRKTLVHPLLIECVTWSGSARKLDLYSGFGLLFFKCAHDRIHVDLQHTGCVSNATPVEGHVNDLLLDTRFMGFVGVYQLETTLAVFTLVALIAVGTESFSPNGVLIATIPTRDDESYHTMETKSPWLRHDHSFYKGYR